MALFVTLDSGSEAGKRVAVRVLGVVAKVVVMAMTFDVSAETEDDDDLLVLL